MRTLLKSLKQVKDFSDPDAVVRQLNNQGWRYCAHMNTADGLRLIGKEVAFWNWQEQRFYHNCEPQDHKKWESIHAGSRNWRWCVILLEDYHPDLPRPKGPPDGFPTQYSLDNHRRFESR
jgi:hypothetical protein